MVDCTVYPQRNGGDSAKESENSKEISVVANEGKSESNYIDEKEASRARAEAQLIAQKNSELNSPKLHNEQTGLSRGQNIALGVIEILGATVVFAGSTISAAEIEIFTSGLGSYFSGMAVVEGYAMASTLCAYGIARLSDSYNSNPIDDFMLACVPAEVDVGTNIYDYSNERRK